MITKILHPDYLRNMILWRKYRRTYDACDEFRDTYLVKFSERESQTAFYARKNITYIPAFAKAAINDIRNSIFQRMTDISRKGGDKSYQDAVEGRFGGVDMHGSSMNSWLGREVLPELLITGKVGLFIDAPKTVGYTLAEQRKIRPYVYIYRAEEIRSWTCDVDGRLTSVLLESRTFDLDESTQLPTGNINHEYKHITLTPNGVKVDIYDDKGKIADTVMLGLSSIPLIILDIGDSLLKNAADYQIALMNLASSDLAYALKSNFPFYVEQYDPRAESIFNKDYNEANKTPDEKNENKREISLGPSEGRAYPLGVSNPPAFIHPSSEPLEVSMKKQEVLKAEIRLLVNLSVSNLQPAKVASAESKQQDDSGLEAGLSFIGLVLEHGENEIARIWSEYIGKQESAASIKYPEKYSLKSDADRREDAKAMKELVTAVPSQTYKKEVAKELADILLGNKISVETLRQIYQEIDTAKFVEPEPTNMQRDVELGIASKAFVAEARGYPEGVAEQANKEHAERLATIQAAQAKPDTDSNNPAARGNPDLSGDPEEEAQREKEESQNRDVNDSRPVRGEGR